MKFLLLSAFWAFSVITGFGVSRREMAITLYYTSDQIVVFGGLGCGAIFAALIIWGRLPDLRSRTVALFAGGVLSGLYTDSIVLLLGACLTLLGSMNLSQINLFPSSTN